MAKVSRLKRFGNQSLVVRYAAHFGLDPDKVFVNASMDGLINILEELKEEDEFNDRFTNLWHLINKPT